MCVLHRAQGVGGGFKTSLGKHKLQTVEITGVQTGRDPKQDPTFLCNPLPQACCLCSSFNGRKRQWGKTAKEGETKEMAGMFLMWLTETWLGWPRGPSAVFQSHLFRVSSAHLQDVHQFVGSSSSFLLHDSSLTKILREIIQLVFKKKKLFISHHFNHRVKHQIRFFLNHSYLTQMV